MGVWMVSSYSAELGLNSDKYLCEVKEGNQPRPKNRVSDVMSVFKQSRRRRAPLLSIMRLPQQLRMMSQ